MPATAVRIRTHLAALIALIPFALIVPAHADVSPTALAAARRQIAAAVASGDKQRAEQIAKAAIAGAGSAPASSDKAGLYYDLAGIELDAGEQEAALRDASAGETIARACGNKAMLVHCLNVKADALSRLGRNSDSMPVLEEVVAIEREIEDDASLAKALVNVARAYNRAGRFPLAKDALDESIAISHRFGDRKDEAYALRIAGTSLNGMQQYDDAVAAAEKARSLYNVVGDPVSAALCTIGIANIYARMGRLGDALDLANGALATIKQKRDTQHLSDAYNIIGVIYYFMGQYEKSANAYQQALAIDQANGDVLNVAYTYDNIALAYDGLHDLKKSLPLHKQALAMLIKLDDKVEVARAYYNLSDVYKVMGDYSSAQDNLQRGLALFKEMGDQRGTAECLNGLGQIAEERNQHETALADESQALAIRTRLNDKLGIMESLDAMGDSYRYEGRYAESLKAYSDGMTTFEAVGREIVNPADYTAFQSAKGNFYRPAALDLVELSRPMDALVMAERGRAKGLARQAALARVRFDSLLAPSDAASLASVEGRIAQTESKLREALGRSRSADADLDPAVVAARKGTDDAERDYDELHDALLTKYPQFSRVSGVSPPTAADLTALAASHPDTLYLEYVVFDDDDEQPVIFALSHQTGVLALRVALRSGDVRAMCAAWSQAIAQRQAVEASRARKLSAGILGGVEAASLLDAKRFKHLVFVMDDALTSIPPAALMDGSGRRLVERFGIATAVSLGTLTWPDNGSGNGAARGAFSVAEGRPDLLAAVDPDGPAALRLASAPAGAITQLARTPSPSAGTVQIASVSPGAPLPSGSASPGPSASGARAGYGQLHHARDEARRILALYPASLALAGPAAREADIKALMPRCDILHFATHGILDSENGLRSWLLLAAEQPDSSQDGRLEAREIADIPLHARLAVLSACQTALGQQAGGDGLVGLAWAFRAAGVPAVVASQWSVDDAATGDLMAAFYRGLRAHQPKDDALRAAMLAVRAAHPEPYYWAAFQIIGEARGM